MGRHLGVAHGQSAAHELFDEHEFDAFVEGQCEQFYAPSLGRPSLTPGIYFRSLLIGYFH